VTLRQLPSACSTTSLALGCAWLALLAACGGESGPQPPSGPPSFDPASFREAARITGLAELEVLLTVRAGLLERDVKATIDDVFRREDVTLLAFPHIVASGPNALELHYAGDARQLQDGDLLLADIGATYDGHCADLTRTYPVSGRYTPRQRELYELVLEVQREAAARARPGVDSLTSIHLWARQALQDSPLRALDGGGTEQTMDRFFTHFIGHYLGRSVHGEDTGWSTTLPLEPGQVLTLEPGLYVASEGIGIRIEDDYLVTASGVESLSPEAPKDVAEIERLMAEPRSVRPGGRGPTASPLPAAVSAAGRGHMDFGPPRQP
jgi:Xaa-Pro aminopeptidase